MPYAGRLAIAKKFQKKLFDDTQETETENPFNSFFDTDFQMEHSSLHCNLLKVVDEKIDQIRKLPTSETFINRISMLDYNTESPLNKEENNYVNSIGNPQNDLPKYKARQSFECLNTIEKAILIGLERGTLDRSEGTIFQKIEHEIKQKKQTGDAFKKWSSVGKCVDKNTTEKRTIKSSTPYASKIPIFHPSTVPKISTSKFKTNQKIKPKSVMTHTRKGKLTYEKEKPSGVKNSFSLKTNHSAIFGKNPFTTEDNSSAFKLKEKTNASSLWVPIEKTSACSSRRNSATPNGTSTINDFVEHQTKKINDLGNCQKRMKEDIEEILTMHQNFNSNVHCNPKSKICNK